MRQCIITLKMSHALYQEEEKKKKKKKKKKTLILVDFTMHRETEVGLASLSVGKPTTTTQRSVFDVLMSSSIFFCGRDDLM